MSSTNSPLECTGRELFYLSSLAGGGALIGIPDPFTGWLADDIADAMQQAQADLAQRHVVAIRPDSQAIVAPHVMRLVETVIAPGTAFLVTMTNGNGDSEQHGFYLKGSTVARLSSYPTARYQLSPIDSIETVYHHIITMWNVQQQPAAPATSVRLPEATMRTMQHQIAAGHTISHIATLLAQASIPRSTGEVLATALTTPRCNSSLAMLHRKEHVWLSDGIGMLDSATGLWQLQSLEHQGISWIELSPCDASTLATRVRDLLSKGAPVGNYM